MLSSSLGIYFSQLFHMVRQYDLALYLIVCSIELAPKTVQCVSNYWLLKPSHVEGYEL